MDALKRTAIGRQEATTFKAALVVVKRSVSAARCVGPHLTFPATKIARNTNRSLSCSRRSGAGTSRLKLTTTARSSERRTVTIDLTPHQLEILQHAAGLNRYGRCATHDDPRACRNHSSDTLPGHRNHFCAGESDEPDCRVLIDAGLMNEHQRTTWLPYLNCSVSDAGRRAIREQSPAAPKRTRSQQRYRDFLNSDIGISFGEWLKMKTAPA